MTNKVIINEKSVDSDDSFLEESKKWDNRQLGADEQFAELAPESVQEEFKNLLKK